MRHTQKSTSEHLFYVNASPAPPAGVVVTKGKKPNTWEWAAWLTDVDQKPHIVARGVTSAAGLYPHIAAGRDGLQAAAEHLAKLITAIDRAKQADVQDL